jgi:hypothetical protein
MSQHAKCTRMLSKIEIGSTWPMSCNDSRLGQTTAPALGGTGPLGLLKHDSKQHRNATKCNSMPVLSGNVRGPHEPRARAGRERCVPACCGAWQLSCCVVCITGVVMLRAICLSRGAPARALRRGGATCTGGWEGRAYEGYSAPHDVGQRRRALPLRSLHHEIDASAPIAWDAPHRMCCPMRCDCAESNQGLACHSVVCPDAACSLHAACAVLGRVADRETPSKSAAKGLI